MSDKKLALLGIIAVLITAAAVLQNSLQHQGQTTNFSGAPLIEGLPVDSIAAIEISSEKGSQTVRLDRVDDRFVVADKDNYPADVTKINTLINQCLDIRTVEKITENPDNYADLQMTPETAHYMISFMDADQKAIVTVLLSQPDPETNMAHARLLSQDAVYNIKSGPWINARPTDYMNTELVSVSRDKISSVAVKSSDDNYVLTSPEGSSAISLDKMPEDKQFKGTTYQTVFGALNGLRFEDVVPADSFSGSFDNTYICKLYDLTVYKLSLTKTDDKTYVKIKADYLDKTPVEKTVGQVESDEELKKKEAKLLAIDAVKDFNAQHENWVYQIPSYKAEQLMKPLSELIENIPKPEADQAGDVQPDDSETGDVAQPKD